MHMPNPVDLLSHGLGQEHALRCPSLGNRRALHLTDVPSIGSYGARLVVRDRRRI